MNSHHTLFPVHPRTFPQIVMITNKNKRMRKRKKKKEETSTVCVAYILTRT